MYAGVSTTWRKIVKYKLYQKEEKKEKNDKNINTVISYSKIKK